jgi:adenylyltransferase/sulfurtransferase
MCSSADAPHAPLVARVLVVGAGGLGSPVLSTLARSGVTSFTIVDDDRVDITNLHRQTLYGEGDVGRLKAEVAAERVRGWSPFPTQVQAAALVDRVLPDNALLLMRRHDLVVEGADNYATKLLCTDAARLAGVPIVQAGAVRFSGWAMTTPGTRAACVRCVFEDVPRGSVETCSVSGVLGPVVSLIGALQAAFAIRILRRELQGSVLVGYEALPGTLRKRAVSQREDCPLCRGEIQTIDPARYVVDCAA